MCLTSPGSSGENVEVYLLAEENLAVSKVFFHETVMFRDLAPRPTRPPADPSPGRPVAWPQPSPGRSHRLAAAVAWPQPSPARDQPAQPPEPAAGRSRRP